MPHRHARLQDGRIGVEPVASETDARALCQGLGHLPFAGSGEDGIEDGGLPGPQGLFRPIQRGTIDGSGRLAGV